MLFYVGTQIAREGEGIFAARLDAASGRLTMLGPKATVERPTWLLADPRRPVLYAVSEVGNAGDRPAEVLSFAIGADAALHPISRAPSGGAGATHLAIDPAGDRLFVANFGGGEVTTLPIGANGGLSAPLSVQTTFGAGPHRRQAGPHPHGVTLDPSRQFLLAPDMGADRIFIYRYQSESGGLTPASPPYAQLPAGSGPRLVLFGSDGRFAYLLTELSSEIFVFAWDNPSGRLEQVGSADLDHGEAVDNRSAAALAISRDGRFLYVSNRRTAQIQVYAIDPRTGLVAEVQRIPSGGDRPWDAGLSPDGRWMVIANQGSNRVRSFAVDPVDGRLSAVDDGIEIPSPTGIAFVR